MFATLLGGLPRPPLPGDADDDALVALAVETQATLGLEPITDGRLRWPDRYVDAIDGMTGVERGDGALRAVRSPEPGAPLTVAAWAFAASCTDLPVKQALPGPYSLGRRCSVAGGPDRHAVTMGFARALRDELAALAAEGCPLVEVEERDASLIGEDADERALFRAAHEALTDGVEGTHLSLALIGRSAHEAGTGTILAPAYASFAFDLITGPDHWRLVVDVPGECGVVCGAMATRPGVPADKEVLVWAADYAASTRGRGLDRVGLGTAGGLEHLGWEAAVKRMGRLAEGARIGGLRTRESRAVEMDPRAVDIRSAAIGRFEPRPRGRRNDRDEG